jgi:hypothetical protein
MLTATGELSRVEISELEISGLFALPEAAVAEVPGSNAGSAIEVFAGDGELLCCEIFWLDARPCAAPVAEISVSVASRPGSTVAAEFCSVAAARGATLCACARVFSGSSLAALLATTACLGADADSFACPAAPSATS